MSEPGQLPDADDLRELAALSDEQRALHLAALAAEARIALDAVGPVLALLPEPARSVVAVLVRILRVL